MWGSQGRYMLLTNKTNGLHINNKVSQPHLSMSMLEASEELQACEVGSLAMRRGRGEHQLALHQDATTAHLAETMAEL